MHHPRFRLFSAIVMAGTAQLGRAEQAYAQAPVSRAPVSAIVSPVFPSWFSADTTGGHRAESPSSSVALPQLTWWSDGILGAVGLAGNAIGLTLSADQQSVPPEGLDPSGINWGIDRDVIGNPSTSAEKASDVAVAITLAGPPVLALLTQPGVHGFGNVVRRPFVLYGESLLLAQGITQILKPAFSRPRPFTYLPAAERPAGKAYDVATDHAFLSMPSGHAAGSFAAASYAATDNLLSRPDAGSGEHVAVAAIGGLMAGFTSNLRIVAEQHFPSDALVGSLIGTVSGVSIPLLHSYVFPGGGKAPHPGGHQWLVTAVGYALGAGAGIGISSLAY
ncbi:MAG TPA: phosphatase PAP2 family protein [Gemmatimonadales bacterium]|jgi:membrane-associated phospholipid phosphatase|nr:phosphatase PAP2 family protein [Gemmatimonadales bacterium]